MYYTVFIYMEKRTGYHLHSTYTYIILMQFQWYLRGYDSQNVGFTNASFASRAYIASVSEFCRRYTWKLI